MGIRSHQKLLLRKALSEWRKKLDDAFIRVENRKRKENHIQPLPEGVTAWFPFGPNAELFLLTLKVWTLRYNVTLDFILEVLLKRLNYLRRIKPSDTEIHLGLPAHQLVSPMALKFLEEEIQRTYPNGENQKYLTQPIPEIPEPKEYRTLHEMFKNYETSMKKARRKFDYQIKVTKTAGRNYRKI